MSAGSGALGMNTHIFGISSRISPGEFTPGAESTTVPPMTSGAPVVDGAVESTTVATVEVAIGVEEVFGADEVVTAVAVAATEAGDVGTGAVILGELVLSQAASTRQAATRAGRDRRIVKRSALRLEARQPRRRR